MMNQFESLKEHFSGVEEDMEVLLPRQCGITDDEAKNIEDNVLTISSEQMKQFFEPCVTRTIELIDQQVAAIEKSSLAKPKVGPVGKPSQPRVDFGLDDSCRRWIWSQRLFV
jgi:hypothetical protein